MNTRLRHPRRALAVCAIALGITAAGQGTATRDIAAQSAEAAPIAGATAEAVTAADVARAGARLRPRGGIVRVEHQQPDMMVVRAGRFAMGPSVDELDRLRSACREELQEADYFCRDDWQGVFKLSQRPVYLDAFAIDRLEVTAGEYRACVADGGCDVAALIAGDERFIRGDWPMVNVTWQDAVDYCAWAGKRLPTEAEWEKAARGTDGRRWPWGNHDRADGSNHGKGESSAILYTHTSLHGASQGRVPLEYAPDDSDGYAAIAPVGALAWGSGPYGTLDQAGNVAEWVADYYSYEGYDDLPLVNPVRTTPQTRTGELRALRGGSWAEPKFFGRTYYRRVQPPDVRLEHIGFRCARSLD